MKDYGQDASYYVTVPYWQEAVLNLMGKSDDPLRLTGSACDEDTLLRVGSQTNQEVTLQTMWFLRAQLAYYFDELETALKFAKKFRKSIQQRKVRRSHLVFPCFIFYSGLIYLGLAKKTKKRKYLVRARKDMDRLKVWVQGGAVNFYHRLLLLDAQYNSLSKRMDPKTIKNKFEKAIFSAARAGFIQDHALANQLEGEYFLSKDLFIDAEYHLSTAFSLYYEWGAQAVADHLLDRHAAILGDSLLYPSLISTNLQSRTRYSSYKHRDLLSGAFEPSAY